MEFQRTFRWLLHEFRSSTKQKYVDHELRIGLQVRHWFRIAVDKGELTLFIHDKLLIMSCL